MSKTNKNQSFLNALFTSTIGKISLTLLSVLLLLAIFAPLLFKDAATEIDPSMAYLPQSWEHLLGTDELGRDHFARVLYATQLSLFLAICAVSVGIFFGLIFGSIPWLAPKFIGSITIAGVNIAIAFPSLLLALFSAVIFGRNTLGAVLAVGLAMIPWFARITQNLIAGVREREFVSASLVLGQSRLKILFRHILPNTAEPLVVNAMLGTGGALLAFAGLSFLGLGLQPPTYDWGLLLNEGVKNIYLDPQTALAPALMILTAGLAFNLFGEALARAFEYKGSHNRKEKLKNVDSVKVQARKPLRLNQSTDTLLTVENLNIEVTSRQGNIIPIVKDVNFALTEGEIVGIVGESGSGKTLLVQALALLNDDNTHVYAEHYSFNGKELLQDSKKSVEFQKFLADNLGYVFQDPSSSFNPTRRFNKQIPEVLNQHFNISWREGEQKAIEGLAKVGVPSPDQRVKQYPHEFSGGMKQRAMIAMGVISGPKLIIADEPTTALDVSIKEKILRLLLNIRNELNTAVMIISHDISSILTLTDRVMVMYGGRIVEIGTTDEIRNTPKHPYTKALMSVVPTMETDKNEPLVNIPGDTVDFSNPPKGCVFADRCPLVMDICRTKMPSSENLTETHKVSCWAVESPMQNNVVEQV